MRIWHVQTNTFKLHQSLITYIASCSYLLRRQILCPEAEIEAQIWFCSFQCLLSTAQLWFCLPFEVSNSEVVNEPVCCEDTFYNTWCGREFDIPSYGLNFWSLSIDYDLELTRGNICNGDLTPILVIINHLSQTNIN